MANGPQSNLTLGAPGAPLPQAFAPGVSQQPELGFKALWQPVPLSGSTGMTNGSDLLAPRPNGAGWVTAGAGSVSPVFNVWGNFTRGTVVASTTLTGLNIRHILPIPTTSEYLCLCVPSGSGTVTWSGGSKSFISTDFVIVRIDDTATITNCHVENVPATPTWSADASSAPSVTLCSAVNASGRLIVSWWFKVAPQYWHHVIDVPASSGATSVISASLWAQQIFSVGIAGDGLTCVMGRFFSSNAQFNHSTDGGVTWSSTLSDTNAGVSPIPGTGRVVALGNSGSMPWERRSGGFWKTFFYRWEAPYGNNSFVTELVHDEAGAAPPAQTITFNQARPHSNTPDDALCFMYKFTANHDIGGGYVASIPSGYNGGIVMMFIKPGGVIQRAHVVYYGATGSNPLFLVTPEPQCYRSAWDGSAHDGVFHCTVTSSNTAGAFTSAKWLLQDVGEVVVPIAQATNLQYRFVLSIRGTIQPSPPWSGWQLGKIGMR